MSVLLLPVMALICCLALARPWIGVVAYYSLAIWRPQDIWPWTFQDLRITLLVTLCTLVGTLLGLLQGKVQLSRLRARQPMLVFTLCILVNLSHWLSPYQDTMASLGQMPAQTFVTIFNKIILFYGASVMLIDTERKWWCMIAVVAGTTLYYTYWANTVYLTGQHWRFGDNGRLSGPSGMYGDENAFALMFIVGFPTLYYLSKLAKSRPVRILLLCAMPFALHAIVLTGSRGALLSVGLTCIYIAATNRNKLASLFFLAFVALFFLDQGGNLVNRVDNTLDRGRTIEEDEVVDPRLISWRVGIEMIADHPILGVGAQKFQSVFPKYDESRSHVAHNTFLQLASNSGLPAGLIYAYIFISGWKTLTRRTATSRREPHSAREIATAQMMTAASGGFLVCSMFLDLVLYEMMYLVMLLMHARPSTFGESDRDSAYDSRRSRTRDR